MTENRVVVRAARPDELDDVLDLWDVSRDSPRETDDPPSLRALARHDPDGLLVAESNGRVVGSLIAVWDGWRGNMYRLTVHPSYRRRGFAGRLVATGEERLRALGARRISALARRRDSRAAHVWQSAGYDYEEGTGRFVKMIAE